MEFRAARLDKTATLVSIAVTVFLAGLSVFFTVNVPFGWAFAIGMISILIISYLLSPKRYFFLGSQLCIEKIVGKKIIISLGEMEGYVFVPDFAKLKCSRTFGNGGLFGYYGMFSTAEYGSINCQLTNLKNIFIIKTRKGNYAISPLEPLRFEEHLKTTILGVSGEAKVIQPIAPETIILANPITLAIPVVLLIFIIILTLTNYAQLPERIAVHFDVYGNPDRWGPKSSYLISSIVPSVILFAVCVGVFLYVRRTTQNPAIPNFLVLVICFIQLFTAYFSFETYWLNRHNMHLIPLPYGTGAFLIILIFLFFLYHRKILQK